MVGGSRVNDPVGGRIRHVSGLPDSANVVVGVEASFNNLAYSYAESTTDCYKVLLANAT